jgi:hypothetical protein
MSLNTTGVAIAPVQNGSVLWPNEDIFQAVLEARRGDPVSHIRINHPLYALYESRGLIEMVSDWESYRPVDIVAKENSTVADFSAYEDLDESPQDILHQAKFGNGYIAGSQTYSFQEMLTLNSKARVIDLAKAKEQQLMDTMKNHFGSLVIGSHDSDGRKSMGIGRIFDVGASCGGIDPDNAGYEYWNPQVSYNGSGTTKWTLSTDLRAGMRKLERLCSYNFETPDVYLCGEDVYEAVCAFLEGKVGFVQPKLMQDQKVWTDFTMAQDQLGRVYIYDKDMDAKTAWLINTKRVHIRIHSAANFSYQDWRFMPGKEAKVRHVLVAYNIACSRRNSCGLIEYQ